MRPRGRRMKWTAVLAAAIAALAFSAAAQSSAPAPVRLESTLPAGSFVEIKPQGSFTFIFRAVNAGGIPLRCEPEVELPEGWKLLAAEPAFTLPASGETLRLVGVFVPCRTPGGTYTLTYRLRIRDVSGSSPVCAVPVRVPAQAALAVRAVEAPQSVMAGESYRISFLVANEGNSTCRVGVEFHAPDNAVLQAEAPEVSLKAGETRALGLSVRTDSRLRRLTAYRVQITATASLPDSPPVLASATSEVRVIPRAAGAEDDYRRLPIEFSGLALSGSSGRTTGQFCLSGSGALDEEGRKTVDFYLRGPGCRDFLSFGLQQEEYRAAFDAPGVSIRLGDHIFSLTKLTEMSRYGRGAEARFTLARIVTVQAYYAENPPDLIGYRRRQTAARLSVSPLEGLEFGLDCAKTKTNDNPEEESASLQARFASKPLTINAEYALGDRSGASGRALWVDAGGRLGTASYQATYIDADKNFPGCYNNLSYRSLLAGWQPFGAFGLRASYQDQSLHSPSDLFISSLSEKTMQGGIQVDPVSKLRLSLDLRRQERQDLSQSQSFHYRDETLRLSAFSFLGGLNFDAAVDVGRTLNFLTGRTARLREFEGGLTLQPLTGLSLGGHFAYRDQDRDFTGENLQSLDLRLDIGLKFGGTQFEAYYRTSFRREFGRQLIEEISLEDPYLLAHRLDMFEARLTQHFGNGHSVSLRLLGTSPLDAAAGFGWGAFRNILAAVEYSIPVKFPLGRRPGIGVIRGRVFDAEAPGTGLPRVLVQANDMAAMTNDRGEFEFHGVKPDTYYLSLDQKTYKAGRISTQPTPLPVAVEGARETTADIGLTRAATVGGRVVVVPDPAAGFPAPAASRPAPPAKEPAGLAEAVVEIRRGDEAYFQVTDERGDFRFDELRPGQWTIRVYSDDLPEFSVLENETMTLDLGPGAVAAPVFKVLPRRREIRFVDRGEIALDAKGMSKTIKKTASTPESPALSHPAAVPVVLQAGAFASAEKAETLRRSILPNCPTVRVVRQSPSGRTLYRVLIPCADQRMAEETTSRLRARGVEVITAKTAIGR